MGYLFNSAGSLADKIVKIRDFGETELFLLLFKIIEERNIKLLPRL